VVPFSCFVCTRRSGGGHGLKFHDPLGAGLGHVDRPVAPYREVVHGVEHRVAGAAEADGCDDRPVAVELEHARVPGVVVLPTDAQVQRTIRIRSHAEDAAGGLGVRGAPPLPPERARAVEELQARVLPISDDDVGAAGHEAEAVRVAELALAGALLSPFPHPPAVLVEERHAAVHVAVRYVERPIRANGDVGGLIEMRGVPLPDARLTQGHDLPAVVRVLEHLVQPHVGEEDVVLAVDGDAVRHEKRCRRPTRGSTVPCRRRSRAPARL
jgi:hypothetical protein